MKRLFKILPVMALGIMVASCAAKAVVKEEITATMEKPAQAQTVVVPDERVAEEKVAASDPGA